MLKTFFNNQKKMCFKKEKKFSFFRFPRVNEDMTLKSN